MTPKHKKHKIILKYIIINSVNSSDKEENLQSSQTRETSYIQRNKYKNEAQILLTTRSFLGSPLVKTFPSNAGLGGSGFDPWSGSYILHASWPKNQNIRISRSNTVPIWLSRRREDLALSICPQRQTGASVLFSKCTMDNMKMCFWGTFSVAATFSADLVPY